MRNTLIPVFILTFVVLVLDIYSFKGIRLLTANWSDKLKLITNIAFWLVPFTMIVSMLVLVFKIDEFRTPKGFKTFYFVVGFFVLFYVPKLTFISFHLFEDVLKLLAKLISLPFDNQTVVSQIAGKISRSKFLSQIGIVVAVIPFLSIIYGMVLGRFDYKVSSQTLYFDDLPTQFDGFRIAQISDIHIGSLYGNETKVKGAIELLNKQEADVVFITGDMVNNTSAELQGWENIFANIKAKTGKFAILGNHDYGDYMQWNTVDEKRQNLQHLIDTYHNMGFDVLLNDAKIVERNGEKIAIVGVENWGKPPFPQYGDIEKATAKVADIPFKILLSHDPTHWDAEIVGRKDIKLTLSGHTHGMQFAINIPGLRWSPVKFKYPRWGGLYKVENQYLYVNIGFGYIAFPGRVGTPPEIAIIELKRKPI